MSKSKGNELLQELYERLNGLWHKKGKYKNEPCGIEVVKDIIKRILGEYEDDTDIKGTNTTDNQEQC